MPSAFVALGSNLGDRAQHITQAVEALPGALTGFSPVFETAPMGPSLYPFLNAVARVEVDLSPRELLDALHAIETQHGRVRTKRWGPRELDLDILLYDARAVDEPGLQIPHPEMARRDFVLGPLVCLAPEARVGDTRVLDLWQRITQPQIHPYIKTDVPAPFGNVFGAPP